MSDENFDPLHDFQPDRRKVLSTVQLNLVFWGSSWATSDDLKELKDKVERAAKEMCAGGYLWGLAQYNHDEHIRVTSVIPCLDSATSVPKEFTDPADPLDPKKHSDVVDEIKSLIKDGKIAVPTPGDSAMACDLLCIVIMPPDVKCGGPSPKESLDGQHFYFDYEDGQKRRVYYGWVLHGSIQRITTSLSEELVEAITDPVPDPAMGWQIKDNMGIGLELCDVCAGITADVGGVRVQTYYSAYHRDAIAGIVRESSKNGSEPWPPWPHPPLTAAQ